MATKIYLHQHAQFKDLISIISDKEKIDPYLAEKDYWIMHCLYGLHVAGYDFQLKGGTSLSKGYKIIHRFSEDIDIHITPPVALNLKTGRNNNKPAHIEARSKYYQTLADEINIIDIDCARDTAFDDESRYRSGGIRLAYNSHFDIGSSSAKEGVLLEVGFDDVAPNKPIDISSWAYDHAASIGVDVIDNRAKGVLCYEPGYTFVEKLQTIVTKFRSYKTGGSFPANFMRHYYDVYCLLKTNDVKEFIGTSDYHDHKKKRFPLVDYEIPIPKNQAFLLEEEETYKLFKREYESKGALYYEGQPDFDVVIGAIKDVLHIL